MSEKFVYVLTRGYERESEKVVGVFTNEQIDTAVIDAEGADSGNDSVQFCVYHLEVGKAVGFDELRNLIDALKSSPMLYYKVVPVHKDNPLEPGLLVGLQHRYDANDKRIAADEIARLSKKCAWLVAELDKTADKLIDQRREVTKLTKDLDEAKNPCKP